MRQRGGAGELVLLSGDLHDLYRYTFNANSVTIEGHDNPQGPSGTGLTTGDKYQGTGVTQFEQTSSLNTLANEYTYVNNFRIIGQGPGNNYLVHYTYHFPFNANGELTSTVDNVSVECK